MLAYIKAWILLSLWSVCMDYINVLYEVHYHTWNPAYESVNDSGTGETDSSIIRHEGKSHAYFHTHF